MFPANNLEKYLEQLSVQNWTEIPFNREFALNLHSLALNRSQNNLFKQASISENYQIQSQIRNDHIYWIDNSTSEIAPLETQLLKKLADLMLVLKDYFRTSINNIECHYAIYPAGHFYKAHKDTTEVNNKRLFSFVIYLNEFWPDDANGELVLYNDSKSVIKITPLLGKLILFRSDVEHEVLLTNQTRYSISGWFRK